MRFRTFGRMGWSVSEIAYGTWSFGGPWGRQDDGDSIACIRKAVELGCNLFDTAATYGRSEAILGRALREFRRDDVFIATKTPPLPGSWPPTPHEAVGDRYPDAYIRDNVEQRLRALGTDRIDILLLHVWSRSWNADPQPLAVLEALKREGKIRAFGISTPDHDQDQLNTLLAAGSIDVVQLAYNLFEQQPAAEALPLASRNGVAVMARLVLDEGSLSGKWNGSTVFAPDDFRARMFAGDRLQRTVQRVELIQRDLAEYGLKLPLAAIGFVLASRSISTAVLGMRSLDQVVANCGASDLGDLPGPLLARLRAHAWSRGNWHAGK